MVRFGGGGSVSVSGTPRLNDDVVDVCSK